MFESDSEFDQRAGVYRPRGADAGDAAIDGELPVARIPCHDRGGTVRLFGLLAGLLAIFGGIAWFLQIVVRVPAHAASVPLASMAGIEPTVAEPVDSAITAADQGEPDPDLESLAAALFNPATPWQEPRARGPHGTGTIELILRHQLSAGRIIVALDDRVILSKPFVAATTPGEFVVHRLSVVAGRHAVRVEILNPGGLIHATGTVGAYIKDDSTTRLEIEHQEGAPHTINLRLSSEDEAGEPVAN